MYACIHVHIIIIIIIITITIIIICIDEGETPAVEVLVWRHGCGATHVLCKLPVQVSNWLTPALC